MTAHCKWCPFPGCDSCAHKGGETVSTTPTGTPVLTCGLRSRAHSISIGHCRACGRPIGELDLFTEWRA